MNKPMKDIKQQKEEMQKRFDEKAKKLFIHGGLSVLLDYPPHDKVLDDKSVKSFIESEIDQAIAEGKQEQWEKMTKELNQFIDSKIAEIEKKSENNEMLDSEAGFIAGLKFIKKEANNQNK